MIIGVFQPALFLTDVIQNCPVFKEAIKEENRKVQNKRVLELQKKMREDGEVQIADEKEKQEQLAVETEL